MENFINELQNVIAEMQHNMLFSLKLIALLLVITIINKLLGYRLNFLGIHPRKLYGLPGILFAPFLHADFNHLFFNSVPLFVLSSLVLLNGYVFFLQVTAVITLISGLVIWLVGRKAIYIGASNLIMGYFGFLVANAYYQKSAVALILGVLCIYYFGGLFLAIFPKEKGVSWEGHLIGFLSGILFAYFYPFLAAYLF
jgi:membrane associated rhomboid family serine protease